MKEIREGVIIAHENDNITNESKDMFYKTIQRILNAPSSNNVEINVMSRIYNDTDKK